MTDCKKITAIEVQKKRKNRRSIYLNGEYAFGIDVEVLLKHAIGVGDELSEEKVTALVEDDLKKSAKDKAMRLLGVRARSVKEIRDRLKQGGFNAKVVEWTLSELERLDLLNDREFAQMYARSRMVTRPVGSFLLKRELSAKGVSDADVEAGVHEAYKDSQESDVARRLATKRKKRYVNILEPKAKKRVSDFLLRRGFSWEIVNSIIDDWQNV